MQTTKKELLDIANKFQTPIALHAIGDQIIMSVMSLSLPFQTPIALHAIGDIAEAEELQEAEMAVSNPYRITCYRG